MLQQSTWRPVKFGSHHRRRTVRFMSHLDGDTVAGTGIPVARKSNATPLSVVPIDMEGVQNDIDMGTDINNNAEEVTDKINFESSVEAEGIAVLELSTEGVGLNGSPTTESSAENDTIDPVVQNYPSVGKIIKFAIPAVGVWLCGPILSLIDTAAVGLLAGTKQQAGLNPAVAICDYSALMIAFMYTATTNLVASAQEDERGSSSKPRTANTLVSALQLSGFVGAVLGAMLILTSKYSLRAIIGNDAIDPEVFDAAMKYVNIRALGMPAAAIIGSAQAACLGMQDIRSPLYVLFAAAIVNFIGDAFFVRQKASWLGGAAGAAWATTFSQYAALIMFVKWLTVQSKSNKTTLQNKPPNIFDSATDNPMAVTLKREKLTNSIIALTSPAADDLDMDSKRLKLRRGLRKLQVSVQRVDPSTPKRKNPISFLLHRFSKSERAARKIKTKEESFSSRGFLAGRLNFSQFLSLPPLILRKEFYPYFLPVTTTSVGRVSAYVAMSHVVSSSLGTLSMAAQQITTSVFYCLTPVADSLSLTAQSFVPAIYERSGKSMEGVKELKKTAINFITTGAIFGVFMAAVAICMPAFGRFFTTDASVIAQVSTVAPTLAAIFFVHGIVCSAEGVMLGQRDLSFLGRTYAAYFFTVPYFMLRVKKDALLGKAVSLKSVWRVFLAYNYFRGALWILRCTILSRRRTKLAAANSVLGDDASQAATSDSVEP